MDDVRPGAHGGLGETPGAEGSDNTTKSTKSKETPFLAPTVLSSGAVVIGRTTTIACVDCQASRTIKPQDAFQVKRCVDCQKKYRNKQKSSKRGTDG